MRSEFYDWGTEHGPVRYWFGDPSGDEYNKALAKCVAVGGGDAATVIDDVDNDHDDGVEYCRLMLGAGHVVVVMEDCPLLGRDLDNLEWDSNAQAKGVEGVIDRKTADGNHAGDAFRYAMMGAKEYLQDV